MSEKISMNLKCASVVRNGMASTVMSIEFLDKESNDFLDMESMEFLDSF